METKKETVPQDKKQISNCMCELGDKLAKAESVQTKILDLLSPIMTELASETISNQTEHKLVPLANQIRIHTERLAIITNTYEYILAACEL